MEYQEVIDKLNIYLADYHYQVVEVYNTPGTSINDLSQSMWDNTILDSDGISSEEIFENDDEVYATIEKLPTHPTYDSTDPIANRVIGNWRVLANIAVDNVSTTDIDTAAQHKIIVAQNPVEDRLYVQYQDSLLQAQNITAIINAQGQTVAQQTLSVVQLPAGVYFLYITTNEGLSLQTEFIKK